MGAFEYLPLFAAHWTLATAISIWTQMLMAGARLSLLSPVYLIVPVALSLGVVRNRWWHTLCLIAMTVIYMAQFFGRGLA